MTARSIALFGATGLVGRECLKLVLARPQFARVIVCLRRAAPLGVPAEQCAKVELRVFDFERLADHAEIFAVDQILCALGTTMRKAGSQQRSEEHTSELQSPCNL